MALVTKLIKQNKVCRVTAPCTCYQGCSQGGANGCSAPTTNLDAPTMSLQNVKDKHANKLAKMRATPDPIHVLPLLYRRGW
jgi:hypothetical protein